MSALSANTDGLRRRRAVNRIMEAIAVTQVIGGNVAIHWSLFQPGDTLASRIASQYQGATTKLQIGSIAYLALILLVFSLVANVGAQAIVRKVARRQPVIR